MDETRIILRRDDALITVEEITDGIMKTKTIAVDSLLACITASIRRTGVQSGLLPAGCLSANSFDDGSRRVALVHPELAADIVFYDTRYEQFPLPRMVFGFKLTPDGRISRSMVGVIELTGRLTPTMPMYHYPFSNVSGFHICIGSNTLPAVESLHTLASLPYYILSMPNNSDHTSPRKNKQGWDTRELLNNLMGKTPEYYYTDVLAPNGLCLQDFLNEVAI